MAAELVALINNCTIVYRDIIDLQTTCSQVVSAWHWFRKHGDHDSAVQMQFGASDVVIASEPPAHRELGGEFAYVCSNRIAATQFTTLDGVVTIGKLRDCTRKYGQIVIEMYPEPNDNCAGTVFVAYASDADDDLR